MLMPRRLRELIAEPHASLRAIAGTLHLNTIINSI